MSEAASSCSVSNKIKMVGNIKFETAKLLAPSPPTTDRMMTRPPVGRDSWSSSRSFYLTLVLSVEVVARSSAYHETS